MGQLRLGWLRRTDRQPVHQNLCHPGAFAALRADGGIVAWGSASAGGIGSPSGTGFTRVVSNSGAFAALKADGSLVAWGDANYGATSAPSGSGFTQVFANGGAFTALKADGSITVWGNSDFGGTGAPEGSGYLTVQSSQVSDPVFRDYPASSALSAKPNLPFFANLGAQGVGARYEITAGALPAGLSLDASTGVVSGTATGTGTSTFFLSASSPAGTSSQVFQIAVDASAAPNFTSAESSLFTAGTAGTHRERDRHPHSRHLRIGRR